MGIGVAIVAAAELHVLIAGGAPGGIGLVALFARNFKVQAG